MKNIAFLLAVAGLAAAGGAASANAQATNSFAGGLEQGLSSPSSVPRAAFFVGFGGSYNSINFSHQNIFAQGVSNIYQNGVQVAYGSAGGPTDPFSDSQSTFAPAAQVGYFQSFGDSNWLWGAKFAYSYLGATSTNQNVVIPQVGSFTSSNSSSFTGNVVARSYKTTINHQMALMPFIGRSFGKSFVYVGAGPAVAQTQSKLNGVIGFADLSGMHTNITGTPSNFSSTQWGYGGAALVGATYFFDPFWFVDVNYTYAMTKAKKTNFSAPFASSTSGYVDTGTLSGNYSGTLITQSLTVTINRVF